MKTPLVVIALASLMLVSLAPGVSAFPGDAMAPYVDIYDDGTNLWLNLTAKYVGLEALVPDSTQAFVEAKSSGSFTMFSVWDIGSAFMTHYDGDSNTVFLNSTVTRRDLENYVVIINYRVTDGLVPEDMTATFPYRASDFLRSNENDTTLVSTGGTGPEGPEGPQGPQGEPGEACSDPCELGNVTMYSLTVGPGDASAENLTADDLTIQGAMQVETAWDIWIPILIWGLLLGFCLWLGAWFPAIISIMNILNELLPVSVYGFAASVMLFVLAFTIHVVALNKFSIRQSWGRDRQEE